MERARGRKTVLGTVLHLDKVSESTQSANSMIMIIAGHVQCQSVSHQFRTLTRPQNSEPSATSFCFSQTSNMDNSFPVVSRLATISTVSPSSQILQQSLFESRKVAESSCTIESHLLFCLLPT